MDRDKLIEKLARELGSLKAREAQIIALIDALAQEPRGCVWRRPSLPAMTRRLVKPRR